MLDKIYSEKTVSELDGLKKCPHSVVFTGNVGEKGYEVALMLAKAWLDTDYPEVHPDFRTIDSEKSILTKEDVAVIGESSYVTPALCPYRVYIVKDAFRLNAHAQNSLLKALEDCEPVCKVIFVSGDALLPTIKSRCYCVDFRSVPYDEFLGGGGDLLAYTATCGAYDEYMELLSDEETYYTLKHIPDCFTGRKDPLELFGLAKEKGTEGFFEKAGHRKKMWLMNLLKTGCSRALTRNCRTVEEEFEPYLALDPARAQKLLDAASEFQKGLDMRTAADFFTFIIKLGKEAA